MYHLSKLFTITALLFVAFSSCERDSSSASSSAPAPVRSLRVAACNAFSYADSIFYLREQATNYIVSPTSSLSGTFGATPRGLQINASTGAINVSQSETGLRYTVYFVPAGTKDTCSRAITISGIDYLSRVYRLSRNETVAKPFYNGKESVPTELTSGRAEFDTRTGASATGAAAAQGVAISTQNAAINLKQTVQNGTFGSRPVNGASRVVRIYYRIDDASKKALNFIDVRFTYYAKYSDIPAATLARINEPANPNARVNAFVKRPTGSMQNATSKLRPPDILIVGL